MPFGYCGICYFAQLLEAKRITAAVFSAFRLLRYLLPSQVRRYRRDEVGLSSVPFGYCGICYRQGAGRSSVPFGYCGICYKRCPRWNRISYEIVFSAFRLLRYLLHKAARKDGNRLALSSVPFGYCGICYRHTVSSVGMIFNRSSVPFGYCGICYVETKHFPNIVRAPVFSAFRLLRYLLLPGIPGSRPIGVPGLQCLSAIAVFVTSRKRIGP